MQRGGTMTDIALPSGASTGIGSLPHRDARAAAEFSFEHCSIPFVPWLPRRSPAEGSIAQAMIGLQGVTAGQYGSILVDPSLIDPLAPVVTDLSHDAFGGLQAFLAAGRERSYSGWVKWQFVGPVTLGLALMRAGVPMSEAFESAVRCVRERVQHIITAVDAAMPGVRQLVFIEEGDLAELMEPGFALAPDTAIDLVSGALAAIETSAVSGLHVCGSADIPSQLATGPAVLSLPVHDSLVEQAGYLLRFLERGGYIAWGVVTTTGPVSGNAERAWRRLSTLWCELVKCGVDPVTLRRQSLLTPECGLGSHTPSVAACVYEMTSEVSRRVQDQAGASRWVLGA